MFYKKEIIDQTYSLYLNGVCLDMIAIYLEIPDGVVDDIIDYMNEINNI